MLITNAPNSTFHRTTAMARGTAANQSESRDTVELSGASPVARSPCWGAALGLVAGGTAALLGGASQDLPTILGVAAGALGVYAAGKAVHQQLASENGDSGREVLVLPMGAAVGGAGCAAVGVAAAVAVSAGGVLGAAGAGLAGAALGALAGATASSGLFDSSTNKSGRRTFELDPAAVRGAKMGLASGLMTCAAAAFVPELSGLMNPVAATALVGASVMVTALAVKHGLGPK